jgi:hypothetical protein
MPFRVPFLYHHGLSAVSATLFLHDYIGNPPALPDFFNNFRSEKASPAKSTVMQRFFGN